MRISLKAKFAGWSSDSEPLGFSGGARKKRFFCCTSNFVVLLKIINTIKEALLCSAQLNFSLAHCVVAFPHTFDSKRFL